MTADVVGNVSIDILRQLTAFSKIEYLRHLRLLLQIIQHPSTHVAVFTDITTIGHNRHVNTNRITRYGTITLFRHCLQHGCYIDNN